MRAFRYRLQRLWEVAQGVSGQRAAALAAARVTLAEAEASRDSAAAQRLQAEGERGEAAARGVSLADWEAMTAELASRGQQERVLDASLQSRQQAVAEHQEAFLQARRHERALEALRHRALQAWRLEFGREEQRVLDEAAAAARQFRESAAAGDGEGAGAADSGGDGEGLVPGGRRPAADRQGAAGRPPAAGAAGAEPGEERP